eukprot:GGOE01012451.1.p1 GENE.GGOE01012451.1~~GGOE01012451.1.p1  ORF type:complete len:194 (-),score=2.12 GGOE01012451.1:965-1546(-)
MVVCSCPSLAGGLLGMAIVYIGGPNPPIPPTSPNVGREKRRRRPLRLGPAQQKCAGQCPRWAKCKIWSLAQVAPVKCRSIRGHGRAGMRGRNKRGGSHVNEGIKQVAAGVVVEAVCEVWCVHRASCMCVSVCLRARVWRGGVLCVVLCCVWQGPAIEDPNAIFTADARCLARKAVAGAVDSWLAAKLRQATAM